MVLRTKDLPEERRVLVIGGHDPSHGAGITTDVFTLHHLGFNTLSIVTCLTSQTALQFKISYETSPETLIEQILKLADSFEICGVKLGLFPSFHTLIEVVEVVVNAIPEAKILWDPIFKTSTRYQALAHWEELSWKPLEQAFDLVTPNKGEWQLAQNKILSLQSEVLVKSAIVTNTEVTDIWYTAGQEIKAMASQPRLARAKDKRGTGCTYGSYMLAQLIEREDANTAMSGASEWLQDYRNSSNSDHFNIKSLNY